MRRSAGGARGASAVLGQIMSFRQLTGQNG
jgi:hypothetical protein